MEVAVRSLLHRRGLRYRIDQKPLPGLNRKADVIFRRLRIAVFVDGCFWHGCPKHGRVPKTNAGFWGRKVRINRMRDRDTDRQLRDAGWTVLRFWEHDGAELIAGRIADVVAVADAPR